MNKQLVISKLAEELADNKPTRINIRMSKDLYNKILEYKQKSGISISNIIRVSLMKFFVENENN